MIWKFLFFWIFILDCNAVKPEGYKMYDFATWCHPEGGKNIIKLKTGTAIFTVDERNPVTANILKTRDLSCHIELETHNTEYGFHVFFDEMELDVKETVCLMVRSQLHVKIMCNSVEMFSISPQVKVENFVGSGKGYFITMLQKLTMLGQAHKEVGYLLRAQIMKWTSGSR